MSYIKAYQFELWRRRNKKGLGRNLKNNNTLLPTASYETHITFVTVSGLALASADLYGPGPGAGSGTATSGSGTSGSGRSFYTCKSAAKYIIFL